MKMKLPLALATLLILVPNGSEAAPADLGSCGGCHAEQAEPFLESAHGLAGLACHNCHGGDPEEWVPEDSMSAQKNFIGKVGRRDVPAFCARCHASEEKMAGSTLPTDQFDHYRSSFHGKKVLVEGDTTAAVCIDCHGSHDTRRVSDPLSRVNRAQVAKTCSSCHSDDVKMNVYAIPTDQYKKWSHSYHGKAVLKKGDLRAAVCIDCHGAHDIVNPADPLSQVHPDNIVKTCSRCHADAALMSDFGLSAKAPADYKESIHWQRLSEDGITAAPSCIGCHGHHAALPPAVKNVAMVCGRCHVRSEEHFNRSPHRGVTGFSGCVECHSNHRISKPDSHLFVSSCERCHPLNSPALKLGYELRTSVDEAEHRLKEAKETLEGARGFGFGLDQLEAVLDEGRQAKIEVIPALHSLDAREASNFLEKTKQIELRIAAGVGEIKTRVRLRNVSLGMVLMGLLVAIILFKLALDHLEVEPPRRADADKPPE